MPGTAFDLYEASVPVFLRFLARLTALVDAAEAHAVSRGPDAPSLLLQARLAPDMLPFEAQVRVAAGFSLRACFPLAGRDVPPVGDVASSFAALRERIATAMALVVTLPQAAFEAAGSRVIEDRAGRALVSLPAPVFLSQYALPNFFFHLSSAYAILRHCGVPVGKADFDGWHVY